MTSQKSACYPNIIFPLIRGHSHNYTSVLIEDWMIFHYMLSTIQMLQENGFKPKDINMTNPKVWHSTKRCLNNTLKSMEKWKNCILCQNNKPTNFDNAVSKTLRGYCIDCCNWVRSHEGSIPDLLGLGNLSTQRQQTNRTDTCTTPDINDRGSQGTLPNDSAFPSQDAMTNCSVSESCKEDFIHSIFDPDSLSSK